MDNNNGAARRPTGSLRAVGGAKLMVVACVSAGTLAMVAACDQRGHGEDAPVTTRNAEQGSEDCEATHLWNGRTCTDVALLRQAVCAEGDLCKELFDARREFVAQRVADASHSDRRRLEATVFHDLVLTPHIAAASQSNIRKLCRHNADGSVTCASTVGIAAYYDPTTAMSILHDVAAASNVLEGDGDNTLLNCGSGRWATLDLQEGAEVTDEDEQSIRNLCKLVAENFGRATPKKLQDLLAGAGLELSATSGIHLLSDVCGEALDLRTDSEAFTADAMDRAQKMHDACAGQGSFIDTVADGSTTSCGDGCTQTVSADGKTKVTTQKNADGSTTVQETTFGEGGTSETKDTTYTPDGNGGYTVDQTSTFTDPNNSDNNVSRDMHINSDGSGDISEEFEDGSANWSVWDQPGSDGKATVHTTSFDSDGNPSGSTNVTRGWVTPIPFDCTDPEVCSACDAFNEVFDDLSTSCEGSDPQLCNAFGETATCCDADGSGVSPQLVIPDPQGNFVCTGQLDLDATQEVCERRCSVADDYNCVGGCVASTLEHGGAAFDPLDGLCTQIIHDACFSSGPGVPQEVDPPSPIPLPNSHARAAMMSPRSILGIPYPGARTNRTQVHAAD